MIFSILLTIFVLLFIYVFHRLILYPYLEIRRYKGFGFQKTIFSPISGYLHFLNSNVIKYKDAVYETKRLLQEYPNTRGIATHIFGDPMLIIIDSSLKKELFQNQLQYEKTPFVQETLRINGHGNIVSSEKKEWKIHRKMISKAFHYDFLISCIPLIRESTSQIFQDIKELKGVEIQTVFKSAVGLIILRVVFGKEFSNLTFKGKSAPTVITHLWNEQLAECLNPMLVILGKSKWRKLSSRYGRMVNEFDEFIEEVVAKYVREKFKEFEKKHGKEDLSNYAGTSLLENMFCQILLKHEDYTVEGAIGDCLILFIAGTDTTGNLLTSLLYCLENNPIKYQLLMKEINTFIKSDDDITADNLNKMDFVGAVLKEGLRFNPPAAFKGCFHQKRYFNRFKFLFRVL